jgi:hypothetical protein
VRLFEHTSAFVSIRQHASAHVSIRQHTSGTWAQPAEERYVRFEGLRAGCAGAVAGARGGGRGGGGGGAGGVGVEHEHVHVVVPEECQMPCISAYLGT